MAASVFQRQSTHAMIRALFEAIEGSVPHEVERMSPRDAARRLAAQVSPPIPVTASRSTRAILHAMGASEL